MFALEHPLNGLSVAVYALIQAHHLPFGETTGKNQTTKKLAKEIRELGHKVHGDSVDQCGHIVAACLGGKMERRNLFPVSQTSNLSQLNRSERKIKQFIETNRSKNGRAYFRMFLFYEDPDYPARPTRFEYSYILMCDDDGKQKKTSNQPMRFEVYVPEVGLVSIKELAIESARTKVHANHKSKRMIAELESAKRPCQSLDLLKKIQFWSGLGIVVFATLGRDLFKSNTEVIVQSKETVPVEVPVEEYVKPKVRERIRIYN